MAKEQRGAGIKNLIEEIELKRLGDLIAEIERSRKQVIEGEIDINAQLGSELVGEKGK